MPNINPERVLAKAEHIAELRKQLATEEAEFGRLLGRSGPASRVSNGDAPIAQQVLSLLASGPRTRGQIIQALGHEAAVTSALKKHKERGTTTNAGGQWALLPKSEPTPAQTAVTPMLTRKARTGK